MQFSKYNCELRYWGTITLLSQIKGFVTEVPGENKDESLLLLMSHTEIS